MRVHCRIVTLNTENEICIYYGCYADGMQKLQQENIVAGVIIELRGQCAFKLCRKTRVVKFKRSGLFLLRN